MNVPKLRFKEFDGEWEEVMLCKVSDVRDGTHDSPKYVSVGYPLITSKNLNKDGTLNFENVNYINEEDFHKINQRSKVDNNDILFGMIGTIGNPVKVKKPEFAIKNVALIKEKNMSNDYLIHYLKSTNIAKQFYSENKGGTQKFIALNNIRNLKINKPKDIFEVKQIAAFFDALTKKIQLQQQKIDLLQEQKKGFLQNIFPKNEEKQPRYRFKGFYEEWKEVALGELFEKVNERNDGSFNENHWISVAKMYFQNPEKVQSNNIDTRTYVMREGDIAFEGHPNKDFKFGRFVANDIGPGVVSELFPIYRHKIEYDNNYWKNFIQLENIMAPIFAKSITSSGNSSNKLDNKHFLKQKIRVATLEEQKVIGMFLRSLDEKISVQKKYLELLQQQKQGFMQQMFI